MQFDLWFARDEDGQIWFTLADPGEAPDISPSKIENVQEAYRRMREAGHTVAQVGIADIEMLRIYK